MKKTRPKKPYKIQRGRSRMDLQPNKFVETYKKKKKMVEKKKRRKTKMSFPHTAALELRRRRRLMRASREADKLVSQKHFCSQDQALAQG